MWLNITLIFYTFNGCWYFVCRVAQIVQPTQATAASIVDNWNWRQINSHCIASIWKLMVSLWWLIASEVLALDLIFVPVDC